LKPESGGKAAAQGPLPEPGESFYQRFGGLD